MAKEQSAFPTTIDSTLQIDRAAGDVIHSSSWDIIEDAAFELETKVGVDDSGVTASLDYLVNHTGAGRLDICPLIYDSIGQGTWAWVSGASYHWYGVCQNTSHASGDAINYKAYLPEGTYTLWAMYTKGTAYGYLCFSIDGVLAASVDCYGVLAYNVILQETGIVITTAGIKTIQAYVPLKNGSSSNHYTSFGWLALTRTA